MEHVVDQLSVLIIDDDEAMRNLMTSIVTREEHQAVPVASAEEGLNLLPVMTFQVAFVDYNLPGLDGIVLGEFLHRNNPNMTIALVTGSDDRTLVSKARNLSIRTIEKPFKVGDITAVLDEAKDRALARHQQRIDHADDDFAPPLARYAAELPDTFDMPGVPSRIESRLFPVIKNALNNLRHVGRYNERDRTVALCGLICARVLGLRLPRTSGGRTLCEEYDAIMIEHGRQTAFDLIE